MFSLHKLRSVPDEDSDFWTLTKQLKFWMFTHYYQVPYVHFLFLESIAFIVSGNNEYYHKHRKIKEHKYRFELYSSEQLILGIKCVSETPNWIL